jgi:hypothetical protein
MSEALLKYGAGGISLAAEIVGLPVLWPAKLALIGAGYGLDRLGRRHPEGRVGRLTKALGEGLWKGGAFGLISSIVLNTVVPKENGLLFTENLAKKIHALNLPNKGLPMIKNGFVAGVTEAKKIPQLVLTSETSKAMFTDAAIIKTGVESNISQAGKAVSPIIEGVAGKVVDNAKYAGNIAVNTAKATGIVK